MSRVASIIAAADLPPLGAIETATLDFKGVHDRTKGPPERAKDVAAFANYIGGTILIGAVEDPTTHILIQYRPLTAADAKDARVDYELAITQMCVPKPLVSFEPISHSTGIVLAINVQAHVDRLVGVRGMAANKSENHWAFPLRVASQATYLQPDQLPMYADPTVRRALVLLHRIARDEIALVRIDGNTSTKCRLELVDEVQNTVVFVPIEDQFKPWRYPLDHVRTVYRSQEREWTVLLARP